ncbi:protein of unknown function [Methylorubrum extorquens]|uniref:Peptidase M41 domain-containing protein n=1 Tax=Methylorubrum extorquens TaxID=408 RepID=A0A2N9ATF0_METEX|nr:protein of unknown function [Methylorubrum extorquens]
MHELGHGATFHLLYGRTEPVFVFTMDGEYGGYMPIPEINPLGRPPQSREDWRGIMAWTFGGWAAVHLAIRQGRLPDAPEACPGNIGYLGPHPMDEALIRQHAAESGVQDPDVLVAEARTLALDLLRPHMPKLWPLAELTASRGFADPPEIAQACMAQTDDPN